MGGAHCGALMAGRLRIATSPMPSRSRPMYTPRTCSLKKQAGLWRSPGFSSLVCRCNYRQSSSDSRSPPQEAVLKAITEVSKADGRLAQTTNVVMGVTASDGSGREEWRVLDEKVNSYPMTRGFTAIGVGGDDFVAAMVLAVESVLQSPVPQESVSRKVSTKGKYVSVNIGPVLVESSEQVCAVYDAMKRDVRMKYFL